MWEFEKGNKVRTCSPTYNFRKKKDSLYCWSVARGQKKTLFFLFLFKRSVCLFRKPTDSKQRGDFFWPPASSSNCPAGFGLFFLRAKTRNVLRVCVCVSGCPLPYCKPLHQIPKALCGRYLCRVRLNPQPRMNGIGYVKDRT